MRVESTQVWRHVLCALPLAQLTAVSCDTAAYYSVLNHLGSKAVHLQNMTHPNHGADGKISDPRFQPSLHIYYGSGTTNVFDGLPKVGWLPNDSSSERFVSRFSCSPCPVQDHARCAGRQR